MSRIYEDRLKEGKIMPYYGQDAIEEIRESVDIVDLIGEYVSLKKKGKHFVALCPFHSEKTPSFTVNREKQIYYCFGCQNGGDIYNFLMEYEHLDFTEAMERLAERAGIELVPEKGSSRENKKDHTLLEINLEAARYFYACFSETGGKEALAYLIEREVTAETRKRFKIGYAPAGWDDLINHLMQKKFLPKDMERAGIANSKDDHKYYTRFRNRLMFPIENIKGEIIGFGGRILGAGEPKYLNSPETPMFQKKHNLYAINLALPEMKRTSTALLMEGYMDVAMSHQNGFTNAVASLGTAFTKEQAALLSRYVQEVVLVYDSDNAGRKATIRAAEAFAESDILVRVADLGEEKDPDDFIKKNGREAFEHVLNRALPFYEYLLSVGIRHSNLDDIEQKVALSKKLVPYLGRIRNAVKMSEYIKLTAKKLDISEESLRFEIKKSKSNDRLEERKEQCRIERREERAEKKAKSIDQIGAREETELLNLCMRDLSIYQKLQNEISTIEYNGTLTKRCFGLLQELECEGKLSFHEVLEKLTEEEKKKVLSITMDEMNPLNVETAKAWIGALKKESLKKEMEEIKTKMDFLEKEGNSSGLLELKKKFKSLQEQRNRI
ncbi:DNA primase [Clostridia bacterium]|nr:DNA primase [Clostridia bacterium]